MCEFCGTKFKSKVTLRTHTRIHTNDRMFKCTYCDSSYIQRVGLLVIIISTSAKLCINRSAKLYVIDYVTSVGGNFCIGFLRSFYFVVDSYL